MRAIFMGIFILYFTLVSCQAGKPEATATNTTAPAIAPTETTTPSLVPAGSTATVTQTPQPTPTQTPVPPTHTASPTATATQPVFDVRIHPDGGLFVGDQVSFEVIAPVDIELGDEVLQISEGQGNETLLEGQFAPFGIAGRHQATFFWGWDTSGTEAGEYPLSFSVQPLGYTWTQTVTLESAVDVPAPEPGAKWATDESDCCVFYYVTDTASSREITTTLDTTDELAEQAVSAMGVNFTESLEVTLMPRVLGQGGFASGEIYISFLDRNYAGNRLEMVLHHEMVHILDYRLGGSLRPSILIEGLAVHLSGGHYKKEDLISRAAALLDPSDREDGLGLGWYLPLGPLADDFYNAQHEIGYIQAGALVAFMVDTWGWDAYSVFYRDIQPVPNGSQSDALDAALQTHFEITLEELETDFIGMLLGQEITTTDMDDVRLTIELLDTMRRYQQVLDPSAYFLTAWLPNGPLMRENGIVADLVRRPSEIENLVLETLLVTANQALNAGDYVALEEALAAVNAVLEAVEDGQRDPFERHRLAAAHFDIMVLLQESGYIAEQIKVTDGTAMVIASQGWPELTIFEFILSGSSWQPANGSQ